MLIGPESARLPIATTMGARIAAAMYTTSAINARPCEDVAVIVRAPASAAPIAADIAECSDSTLMISVSALPSATNEANFWMIGVCGVIGYTGTTSGSICRIACATASPPVSSCGALVRIGHHLDRVHGADLGADLAALAVALVEAYERRHLEDDGGVRAIEPAEEAVHAGVHVGARFHAGAPAACLGLRGVVPDDGAAEGKLLPRLQRGHAYPCRTASLSSCAGTFLPRSWTRSEEHTSELQSRENLVCRLLLEKKKK